MRSRSVRGRAWPAGVRGGVVSAPVRRGVANARLGRAAEEAAARYLEARGWRILGRNVRVGRGELDLIVRRGPVLAFVEVKARRTRTCGAPEDAVDAAQTASGGAPRRAVARGAPVGPGRRVRRALRHRRRRPHELPRGGPPSRRRLHGGLTRARARDRRQRGPHRPRGTRRRRRGRRRRGRPDVQHRRAARRRRAGEPRAGARGHRQLVLRVPVAAHHRQPRAGRPAQGGPVVRPAGRPRPAAGHRAGAVGNGARGIAAVGELGLDGGLRPVTGALAVAEGVRRRGVRRARPAARERRRGGAGPRSRRVSACATCARRRRCWRRAARAAHAPPHPTPPPCSRRPHSGDVDWSDIAGQGQVKRALEVAVAGAHNVLLSGRRARARPCSPGGCPGIMPPLTLDEAIAVTRVHSVAGLLPAGEALVVRRPLRAPHHTISSPGLVGGGATPRPGEVSLAHLGVLFLDEFPEFRLSALEGLRQPLEDGDVTISRALTSVRFPARIMLVAAMNPCPCGFCGDRERECTCPVVPRAPVPGAAQRPAARPHRPARRGAATRSRTSGAPSTSSRPRRWSAPV